MRKRANGILLLLIIILCFLKVDIYAGANGDLRVGMGKSVKGIKTYRLAYNRIITPDLLETSFGNLSTYFSAGTTFFDLENKNIAGLTFSPLFDFQIKNYHHSVTPYLEFGIGIGLFSHNKIFEGKISTAFQFEDRFGFGIKFDKDGKKYLTLNFIHYSNGGIKKPNEGISTFLLTFGISL
jgi:lipid A 3-O-deacylase